MWSSLSNDVSKFYRPVMSLLVCCFLWQYSKVLFGVDTKEPLLLVPVPNGPGYTYSKQLFNYKKKGTKTAVRQSSAKLPRAVPYWLPHDSSMQL